MGVRGADWKNRILAVTGKCSDREGARHPEGSEGGRGGEELR